MEELNNVANEELANVVSDATNDVVSSETGLNSGKALGTGILLTFVAAGVTAGGVWLYKKLKKAKAEKKKVSDEKQKEVKDKYEDPIFEDEE